MPGQNDALGMWGSMGRGREGEGEGKERQLGRYISASFCVSITAAIGMPKLDAGPQKSVRVHVSRRSYLHERGRIKTYG